MSAASVMFDAVPDRATCLAMLEEIRQEAERAPQFEPAGELTVRYYTVLHWLSDGTAIPAADQAALRRGPDLAAFILMNVWEVLDGPEEVRWET